MKALFLSRLPLMFIGTGLIFAAHRYIPTEKSFLPVLIAGFAVLLTSIAIAFVGKSQASRRGLREEAHVWTLSGLWSSVYVLSMLVHFAFVKYLANKAVPDNFVGKALLAVWLLLLIAALFSGVGVEVATRACGRVRLQSRLACDARRLAG